ncbi:Inner membrane protein YiaV precursor [Botrimarina colliarenosi]|uniref:Inner membrane protein YiaV n=1 Tax=Botrimarina colliarenosi TaxID=2528001 RepID=A0A5C6AEY1_9BACT|nr:HlyD family secretion protein [Botrimarina colliarenosi]TWT97745.1 Inner membrane protein YiaV precursor [Botrimarina colliarenosi]
MMWILAGLYCLAIWLVFAKWRLLRLSLPLAIVLGSVGPALIVALLFCAQYYHPFTSQAIVLQKTVPIVPQVQQRVRVTKIVAAPNEPLKAGDTLFELDRAPLENAVERLSAAVAEAEQAVKVAESSIDTADAAVTRAKADLAFMVKERDRDSKLVESQTITQEEYDLTLTRYQQASTALDQANAAQRQAVLGVELSKAKLAQSRSALKDADYDLKQAVVVAPADGFVTNVQLLPGTMVGGVGGGSVMTFIKHSEDDEAGIVVAMLDQKNFLLVEPGQYAEVALKLYPGRILTGRVIGVIDVSGSGQLLATGQLPDDIATGPPTRFAAKIQLDEAASLRLPGGARGCAAVYTQHVQVAGIPVMFVTRAQSWLNYLW